MTGVHNNDGAEGRLTMRNETKKSVKGLLVFGLVVILLGGIAGLIVSQWDVLRFKARQRNTKVIGGTAVSPDKSAAQTPEAPAPATEPKPGGAPGPVSGVTRRPAAEPDQSVAPAIPMPDQLVGNPPVADPAIPEALAREALNLVGSDPQAEQIWLAAINDPNLSAKARQNLIEDLNENGLSDPRQPGPQDLPLIVNRLMLIEQAAPFAMDQVNWDAFQEAYRDLLNMYVQLTQ